jgi:hypothetical protein
LKFVNIVCIENFTYSLNEHIKYIGLSAITELVNVMVLVTVKFELQSVTLWAGHVARMGEKRNAYRILVGKPEGKRPLGRPRRRWMDNIKMDLREAGWDGMDWINLAQDRDRWRALVNAVMNLRVP